MNDLKDKDREVDEVLTQAKALSVDFQHTADRFADLLQAAITGNE